MSYKQDLFGKRGALQLSIEVLILIVIAVILLVIILILIRTGLLSQLINMIHLSNSTSANVSKAIP